MTVEDSTTKGSSFGRAVGAIIGAVLKFVLAVLILGLIGLIVYFGVIYLYQEVIYPLQTNQYQMEDLEERMALNQDMMDDRLTDFNDRLTVLESQGDMDAESFAQLEANIAALESALADQSAELAQLEKLEASLDKVTGRVEVLEETPEPVEEEEPEEDLVLQSLQQDVKLLKTMTLLSRSKAYLIQKNEDAAIVDIENALLVLEDLAVDFPEENLGVLEGLMERLELALMNLPDNPAIAVEDLEIAWRTMVNELAIPASLDEEAAEEGVLESSPDSVEEMETEEAEAEAEAATETMTPTPTPFITITPTPSL